MIFLNLTNSTICYADDSVVLQKNQNAPFAGILFTQEKSQDLKNKLIERDVLLQLNDSLKNSLNFQQDIINQTQSQKKLLLDQNDQLANSLYKERTMSNVEKAAYFVLGIIAVGVSAYGYRQINK